MLQNNGDRRDLKLDFVHSRGTATKCVLIKKVFALVGTKCL